MSRLYLPLVVFSALLLVSCGDAPLPDDRDGDTFTAGGGDCDDSDPTVHPGAAEIPYDGIDQDCDGQDFADVDGDGFNAAEVGGEDCDDEDPQIKPGAPETCEDGVDQDCDGRDLPCDEFDADGDGYSVSAGDCDDDDASVNPGAEEEPYNGKDDDCDIATPDDDLDEDGYTKLEDEDCDDTDAASFPGATEIPYDGIDQDCSGTDLTDVDGDGYDADSVAGGNDCDDEDAQAHPGGVEECNDGIDQDCVGGDLQCSDADLDGDSYSPNEGDCNDDDPLVNPAATEIPYNSKDDDCDVATPDDDLDEDGFAKVGGGDCDDDDPNAYPGATEVPYDGIDQDCVGGDLVDVDGDGYAAQQASGPDCEDDDPAINPGAAEIPYDGTDQNCDGADTITDGAFDIGAASAVSNYGPSVACNGSVFLVVWDVENGVRAQRVGLDGAKIGGEIAIFDDAASAVHDTALASDGSGFLAVWRTVTGSLHRVHARMINGSGALGSSVEVRSLNGSIYRPGVAYSAGSYAAVWDERSPTMAVWVQRLTPDGQPQGERKEVASGGLFPSVAAGSGTNFLIAFMRIGPSPNILDVVGRLFYPSGTFVGPEAPLAAGPALQVVPHSTYDGANFVTTYYDNQDGDFDVYAQRVAAANGALLGDPVALTSAAGHQYYPTPAYCGNRLTTTWWDERFSGHKMIVIQRMTRSGVLEGDNVLLYAGSTAAEQPDLACGGGKLLVVWHEGDKTRGKLIDP